MRGLKKNNVDTNKDNWSFKFRNFKNKFRLGSHYKMERFGIISILFFVSFCAIMGGSIHVYMKKTILYKSTTALYNNEFSSSLTQSSGTVEGVYVNKNKTRGFVLFKYEDPNKQSLNPDDYKVFLSAKGEHLECKPKGSLQMFGQTGYFGVEIIASEGISNQILDLTFRLKKNISSDIKDFSGDEEDMDATFSKYDQFRVYVNVGAEKAKYAKVLDNLESSPSDIFKELTSKKLEKEYKNTLQEDVNNMAIAMNNMIEIERQMKILGVKVPKKDEYMDDTFMKLSDSFKNYKMKVGRVYKCGYNFDWQNTSLASGGYIKQFYKGDKKKFAKVIEDNDLFLANNSTLSKDNSEELTNWVWKDGSIINTESDLPKNKQATDLVSRYNEAKDTYLSTKQTYQQVDLRNLLLLEIQADEIDQQFVMSSSKNTIVVWNQK